PLAASLALLPAAALAAGTHRVFLFASLGPTVVMMVQQPQQKSSQPYSAFVGQLIGFVSGCAIVFAFGLAATPSVFQTQDVTVSRAGAALVSLLVATALELLLRA